MNQLKVKKLHPDAVIPKYATPGAACFDLHALVAQTTPLFPGGKLTFRTGLAFEIPAGHVMLVFSRSGHGFKNDIRLANCVGVIDSDYRGEVLVKLASDDSMNFSLASTKEINEKTFLQINPGDRIAQAMVIPVQQFSFLEVNELSDTERGTGGFGSTGA